MIDIKKELYLDSLTLDHFSLAYTDKFSCKQKFSFDGAALVVLDMQDFFLSEASHAWVPSAKAIIPGVNNLIKMFVKHDRPVVLTQHLNTEEDASMMAIWWRDILKADNKFSRISPDISLMGAHIIRKSQYDAFLNTDLDKYLKDRKINKLVIAGVMTHLCCETTARSAFCRGYSVFMPVDCTATYNRSFHEASILNLFHGFASVTSLAKLVENSNENL